MKKIIFTIICALALNGIYAEELPKWAKKSRKAVFSIITYNKDNKILNTGNGFYIDENGIGISDYSLFKNAYRAVVVTYDGKELPVTQILGADDMYDVVRFRTETAKKQEILVASETPGKPEETVYILPYSTQNSIEGVSGSIISADSIANNSFYYSVSINTNIKNVSCPLMNAEGKVIGLIQRSSSDKNTQSYALGINFAKNLSINALSANDMTLNSIKIKKGLPEDEQQALVYIYMISSKLNKDEYIELLNDFINKYPNNSEGYIKRATYYIEENKDEYVEGIEDDFKKAINVASNKGEAHYSIAKLLYNYNLTPIEKKVKANWGFDRALEEINSAIECSGEGLYYQVKGDIYFTMKDYDNAYQAYIKVCESKLASASAYYSAAKAKELTEGAEAKEYIALMDSAVSFYKPPYGKDVAPYLFERGRMKAEAKMAREAVMDYNAFYDAMLGQVSAEFYVIRQQAEMQCRMYQQAIDDINKAVELEPSNSEYWGEKGSIHIRLNQVDEAITALEKAVSLNPKNADAYRMLGYCQIKEKDKKKGLENLNKAKELGDKIAEDLIKKYTK